MVDENRVSGTMKQAEGALKQVAGKLTGDSKLKTEGSADKLAGKAQNAMGGMKDALRDNQTRQDSIAGSPPLDISTDRTEGGSRDGGVALFRIPSHNKNLKNSSCMMRA